MLTLDNLRGATHDVWSVNTDYEYHEEQRLQRDEVAVDDRVVKAESAPVGA